MAQLSKGPTPDFSLGYAWSQGCETEVYVWLCAGHWTCLMLLLSSSPSAPPLLSLKGKKKKRRSCWYDASSHPNTSEFISNTRTIPYKPKHGHHPWVMNVNKVLSQNPQTLSKVCTGLESDVVLSYSISLVSFGLEQFFILWLSWTQQFLKITNQLFYRLSLNWVLSDD